MSWFPLLGLPAPLRLHLSIRGDEVRVRSSLIFRYRIWPKKQCILEKHSNLLQKYNSCRLLLTITHKYLLSHKTRKHRQYLPVLQRFDSAFFKSYQIWMLTQALQYIIHLRYFLLWMQKTSLCHTQNFKFVSYLKNKRHILPPQRKNPITFEQECTSNGTNPRYIFPGGRSMKTHQIPMFLHIATRVWGQHSHTQTWKQWGSMFKTAVNLQRKSLCTPECKNLGNMLIDSIWLNVQAKYVLQNDVILLWIRYGYMKVSHRPPVHAANMVANTGKSIRGWRIIIVALAVL